MKLVARLKTIEECPMLSQLGIDVFSVDTRFTAKRISTFGLDDIKQIVDYAENHLKQVYVVINSMIHQADLIDLNLFLKELKKINISGIIINDLTVFVLAQKLGMEDKIIYQPGTMNTDSFSATYFHDRSMKGITLSREITLEEITEISHLHSDIELSIIGHGYLDMFYSKRQLITNYILHKNIQGQDVSNNFNMRLNEEIRPNDFYPIVEDEFGTHIFRSNKLISYPEFDQLNELLTDFFIERLFLEDDEYYDTIRLYNNSLNYDEYRKKYQGFDSGFYYLRTEKIKGEHDEN